MHKLMTGVTKDPVFHNLNTEIKHSITECVGECDIGQIQGSDLEAANNYLKAHSAQAVAA
jgi:hypothetical protein